MQAEIQVLPQTLEDGEALSQLHQPSLSAWDCPCPGTGQLGSQEPLGPGHTRLAGALTVGQPPPAS